jgi:hypothetical protein
VPFELFATGTVLDSNLKFADVIVLSIAVLLVLVRTTTLSFADRVVVIARLETLISAIIIYLSYVPGKYVLSVDESLAVAGVP